MQTPWCVATSHGYMHDASVPHFVQQVTALNELLHDKQASRVLLVVIVIFPNAIARRDIPAASCSAA